MQNTNVYIGKHVCAYILIDEYAMETGLLGSEGTSEYESLLPNKKSQ